MSFDPTSLMQIASYGIFVVFMLYGTKLQMWQMLAKIGQSMKKLVIMRDSSLASLKTHIRKYMPNISITQETQLTILINSIAIPPVSHLDPAGIVPKIENISKTYDKYLKNGLKRIVGNVPQSDLENLTNTLEVAIGLNIFHKIVEHFVKLAKKQGMIAVYQIFMVMPMIMDMAEAYFAASGHFSTGLPIGDGFGPMVAQHISGKAEELCSDTETSVKEVDFEGRRLVVIKAKGPGGSVGNPGVLLAQVVTDRKPSLVVTIDAGLKMESEATGDISEGVGTAMGGNGTERFRIEEATSKSNTPVLTVVCKMTLKEAISQMPKPVFEKVDYVVGRVLEIIRENTESGNTIVIVGVGNTMGVE